MMKITFRGVITEFAEDLYRVSMGIILVPRFGASTEFLSVDEVIAQIS